MKTQNPSLFFRALCLFLVILMLVLAVEGLRKTVKPREVEAQFGEFAIAFAGMLLGGIFGNVLDHLFGMLKKGGPDAEEIIEKINAVISNIAAEMEAAEKSVSEIMTELMETELYQALGNPNDAAAVIETFWNDEFMPRFSGKQPGEVSEEAFSNFCEAVIGGSGSATTYPLENAFNTIYHSMQHDFMGARGVLDAYTDYSISTLDSPGGDFSATVESTNGVDIVAERPMYFDYQGLWNGGHCQAGLEKAGKKFYFAEGTTRPLFDSYLCLMNPGDKASEIKITYMLGDSTNHEQKISVPARTRSTVNVGDVIGRTDGAASDFSALVEVVNDVPVLAERPMYFNYKGSWDGGHCNAGIAEPAARFFFAEGTCRTNFETYFSIQNPNDNDTTARLTYHRGNGSIEKQEVAVPARTRVTVRPGDLLGHGNDSSFDFSTTVESLSGNPLVVERPVYFNYGNAWLGGHCESGRLEPAERVYFAEGTVRPEFDSFICLANPASTASNIKVTFMRGDGTTTERSMVLAAHSRQTLSAREVIGSGDSPAQDFSVMVETTDGTRITAERAMYFNYKGKWAGGHCEAGMLKPADTFHFAEGTVRSGFNSYICVQNPSDRTADVRITYLGNDGRVGTQHLEVGAHSRSTVSVGEKWNTLQRRGAAAPDALSQQYVGLENIFSKFIHDQVMAADMICEAMNYDPGYGKSAQDYLNNTVRPAIQDEISVFLDNAERLVMSQSVLNYNVGQFGITLPAEGRYILDRANFVANLVGAQTMGNDGPVLMGRVVSTTEITPCGTAVNLTAKDTKTGEVLTPVTAQAVPPYSGSNPYNATVWQKQTAGGVKESYFYDTWDSSKKDVNYTSQLSVARYLFSGAKAGSSYDIYDAGGKLATVTVNTYDGGYNVNPDGDYVFGSFEIIRRNNGADIYMDGSLWKEDTSSGTHSSNDVVIDHSADLKTPAPKIVNVSGKDNRMWSGECECNEAVSRTFEADCTANAVLHYIVDVDGKAQGGETPVHGCFLADYSIWLVEEETGTVYGADDPENSANLSFVTIYDPYTVTRNLNKTMDLPLTKGNHYTIHYKAHVKANSASLPYGPYDVHMKLTINDMYLSFPPK